MILQGIISPVFFMTPSSWTKYAANKNTFYSIPLYYRLFRHFFFRIRNSASVIILASRRSLYCFKLTTALIFSRSSAGTEALIFSIVTLILSRLVFIIFVCFTNIPRLSGENADAGLPSRAAAAASLNSWANQSKKTIYRDQSCNGIPYLLTQCITRCKLNVFCQVLESESASG